MVGLKVKVVAVLHDDADGSKSLDADELQAFGGIGATDRLEVKPWCVEAKRFSWVSSDPKARDLV